MFNFVQKEYRLHANACSKYWLARVIIDRVIKNNGGFISFVRENLVDNKGGLTLLKDMLYNWIFS